MPRWSLKEGLEEGWGGFGEGLEVFGILSHFRASWLKQWRLQGTLVGQADLGSLRVPVFLAAN